MGASEDNYVTFGWYKSDNFSQKQNNTDNNSENNEMLTLVRITIPCKDSTYPIDEATAKTVERMLFVTLVACLEIFGFSTNVINMAVFYRQGLRDRINLCLFSLALADCTFLLVIFSGKFYSFLGLFNPSLEEYWSQKHLNTVLGAMLGTMNVSNAITMIISLERCICVLSPFIAKKILKTEYMAIIIIFMAVYILGFFNLMNMKYVTVYVTDPVTNESHWSSGLSSFYLSNRMVTDVLNNYLLGLTIPCTSLGVVMVTTCITVVKLRSALAWRQESAHVTITSKKDRKESAVTKTLLVVCFVYLTCISLSVAQVFLRTFVPGYLPTGKYCNAFVVGQTIGHLCEVINSSVTFVIYFTMGTKFRTTVKQIFGTERKSSSFVASVTDGGKSRPSRSVH